MVIVRPRKVIVRSARGDPIVSSIDSVRRVAHYVRGSFRWPRRRLVVAAFVALAAPTGSGRWRAIYRRLLANRVGATTVRDGRMSLMSWTNGLPQVQACVLTRLTAEQ